MWHRRSRRRKTSTAEGTSTPAWQSQPEITKTLAICMQCGNPAKHTQRLIGSEDLIVVGAEGMYEARCRRCFEPNLAADEAQKKKKAEMASAGK